MAAYCFPSNSKLDPYHSMVVAACTWIWQAPFHGAAAITVQEMIGQSTCTDQFHPQQLHYYNIYRLKI